MSIIALTSVTGAPGVTTTAVAWAYLSNRPTLIVEADPTGGSAILAGLWDGAQPHDRSILSLATQRPEEYADRLWASTFELPGAAQRWLLPGIGTGGQAAAMMPVWPAVADALREISETGIDILIDAGRVTAAASPWMLIDAADTTLVLARTSIQAINSLSIALPDLRDGLTATGTAHRLGVVTVTGAGRSGALPGRPQDFGAFPYSEKEVADVASPTAVVASVEFDPRAAAVYSNARPAGRTHGVSGYVRSIRHLIESAEAHAGKARSITDIEGGTL